MQRLQAFKFQLLPNGQQQRAMRCCAGSCRFVYNKALAWQKQRHEQGQKQLGYAGLCQLFTEWKAQTPWLFETPSQALQQSLKDLARAYQNFFEKRAAFPRFKRKEAKARVQRMHQCIANARHDFLHKASHALSKNHAMVCIEDLQVQNMSRTAAGTLAAPG
jgi:transposase